MVNILNEWPCRHGHGVDLLAASNANVSSGLEFEVPMTNLPQP
jgi:hypothetical protein